MSPNTGNKIQVNYLCKQPFWNLPKKDGQTWCKSCKKHIPDLREADRETILELKRKDGEACGIFYPDQFEVNEQTRKSPTVFRLILAGALTVFAANKASAQTVVDSVKTEQHDTSGISSQTETARPESNPVAAVDAAPATTSNKKPARRKRVHLFWLGSREFYLNGKLPFIHSHVMRMGKF